MASLTTKSLLSSKSFNLQHAFRPVITINPRVSENIYHPLHQKALERLKEQDKPQLIVKVTATIKRTSPKAVVRNRSKHRVREATYQVLKENGYGRDGTAEGRKENLVGTMAFFTTDQAVLTPWEGLKEEVRVAVGRWMGLRQGNRRSMDHVVKQDARPRSRREHGEGSRGMDSGAYGRERVGNPRGRDYVGAESGGYPRGGGRAEVRAGRGDSERGRGNSREQGGDGRRQRGDGLGRGDTRRERVVSGSRAEGRGEKRDGWKEVGNRGGGGYSQREGVDTRGQRGDSLGRRDGRGDRGDSGGSGGSQGDGGGNVRRGNSREAMKDPSSSESRTARGRGVGVPDNPSVKLQSRKNDSNRRQS